MSDHIGSLAEKTCNRCKKVLPLERFDIKQSSASTRRNRCRSCTASTDRWNRNNADKMRLSLLAYRASGKSRALHLRKERGIEPVEYDEMLKAQQGVCAICASDTPGGRWPHFHVDHCHDSGAIRGLLCNSCNRGLGLFKDRADLLFQAAKYLSRPPQ